MTTDPDRHNFFPFIERLIKAKRFCPFPAGLFIRTAFWAAFLSGCIHMGPEITKVNSDTYSLQREGADSLSLRQQAWRDAESFCTNKDQYFMLTRKDYSESYYKLTFRCLSAGDPELLENEGSARHWLHQKTLGGYGKYEY